MISKLDKIHDLGLVDDKNFVIRVLPKVSGVMLVFFGDCLRGEKNWDQCKSELVKDFFSPFHSAKIDTGPYCF